MGLVALKHNIRRMARRFIAGETPAEALAAIYKLRPQQCAFTLGLLGEATLTEEEALAYQQRYLALLPALAEATQTRPVIARIDTDPAGALTRLHVSLKLSAG
jgi:RHH-type proline utilization regulon transcriptional repressor/proline dehydrogenase/delta 1-pyrroline-5-carboxylate dehydrogenase